MVKSVYLDVCTLCRPFDNQSYLRIRLETEAVNLILSKVHSGELRLMVAPVHYQEIESISETKEKAELNMMLTNMGRHIVPDLPKTRERADELVECGLGVADAAHVAFAEQVGATFVSCDDKLIKKCVKCDMKIWVGTPIAFCEKENLK